MDVRDAIADWKAFDADSIPTKGVKLPQIFEETLKTISAASDAADADAPLKVLELGCGRGELADRLAGEGHAGVGVDANEDAIAIARRRWRATSHDKNSPTFLAGDVTTLLSNGGADRIAASSFDFCVLQLLLSVVGNRAKRCQTLSAAFESLRNGGRIYASCSGVSDEINENYKSLYERDFPATGEMHTYFSRDGDGGNVLYATHHFSVPELETLLEESGFVDVDVRESREASSRRPEEAAYFLYAVARKPPARGTETGFSEARANTK